MGRDTLTSRRRLLSSLAPQASCSLLGSLMPFAQELCSLPDPMTWGARTLDRLIGAPREALDVFDFEAVAHKNPPPADFGYLASGVAAQRAIAEGPGTGDGSPGSALMRTVH